MAFFNFKIIGLGAKDFPNAAVQPEVAKCTATKDNKDDGRGCDCPSRVEAPDPPAYRKNSSPVELEVIIRKHYASSAFNKCERQKLPVMKGQPCVLFVDPKARPLAIHRHRPVAIHWEKETKQGLNKDTDMGVIWPKLMGNSTLLCAPMHIVAQKTGKPRRVVEF